VETDIFDAIRDASNHLRDEPTEDGLEHQADVAAIEMMLRANPALVHARQEFTESTPLHAAAEGYLPRIAELLLKFGADVNATAQGAPVLSRAVSNDSGDEFDGQVKVVEVLIRHGADLNASPPENFTPLYTAVSTCKDRIADLLLKAGAEVDVHSAVALGRIDSVKAILRKDRAAVKRASPPGYLFRGAIYENRRAEVQALSPEMVALLLENGLDPNAPTASGTPPLHCACGSRNPAAAQVAQILLDHGAAINAVHGGRTALNAAQQAKNQEVIDLLNKAGAKLAKDLKPQGARKRKNQ
jgi:ankyrin repeat protein